MIDLNLDGPHLLLAVGVGLLTAYVMWPRRAR
jgi:hypothetical protein